MNILGISCFYHDSAACLIRDGEIIAAASEERFTRKKHDPDFPVLAVRYCLEEGRMLAFDLDYIGFYDKPFRKFDRILTTYLSTFPCSYKAFLKAMQVWLKQKIWTRDLIRKELDYQGPVLFTEHHVAHAASAFLVSPFQESAILTVDGVGEWATTAYGFGKEKEVTLLKEIHFPHSLGLLYSALTYYLGFKVNSAEYKVMGLAPYGQPTYYDRLRQIIDIREDGSFWMDMDYFEYHYGLRMTNDRFHALFGAPPREAEGPMEQYHMDIAASVQKITDEIMLKMARNVHQATGLPNLCLAGGVALNCVANGHILRESPFQNVFVQPAAGDAGGALGVASYIYHTYLGHARTFTMNHAFWGPEYTPDDIRLYLKNRDIPFTEYERPELLRLVAQLLADQKVVGWFQGRMEFGPRALGGRSILADPRNPDMKDIVNKKIKFREGFRPFAPTVLEEATSEYFDLSCPSPFMLLVAQVHTDKLKIPAVTHVDGSARIQTLNREQNPVYYDLISEFYALTGCPILLNTSFNVRGEPMVCSPNDALTCFMRTHLDYLVIGNFVLDKQEMRPIADDQSWQQIFELD